jgi:cell division protein FtsL
MMTNKKINRRRRTRNRKRRTSIQPKSLLEKYAVHLMIAATMIVSGAIGSLYFSIEHQTTRLDANIHQESKEIRKLVSDNSVQIGTIKGQIDGIETNLQIIIDRLTGLPTKFGNRQDTNPAPYPQKR